MDERLFQLIKQGATIRQLQLMLETGVDVDGFNERRETPLMSVLLNVHDVTKREQMVRLLLLFSANINCRNLRGQTPFMYACILNQLDTLNILLSEPSLECNFQDFEGNTALMYACALGNTEAVRTLVNAQQHGAIELDPDRANAEGTTAMDYALDSRDEDIKELLTTLSLSNKLTRGSPVVEKPDCTEADDVDEAKTTADTEWIVVEKTSNRIKQLAGTLEIDKKPHGNDTTTSTSRLLTASKEPGDTIANGTWSNISQSPSKETILPRRSVINVHLPKPTEDYIDNGTYAQETAPTVDSDKLHEYGFNQQESTANSPYKGAPGKKNKKRSGKSRKLTRQKNKAAKKKMQAEAELFIIGAQPRKEEFGEEVIFCNKIYGADLYPCAEEEKRELVRDETSAILDSITTQAVRNLSKVSETKINREGRKISENTGKLDYMQLSPQDRGKLLGRTIWSIYGEPLPPIPITTRTMENVMRGITKLRRFLSKARYQPGRLLSLDPEMWCIVESMRCTGHLKRTF